MLLRELGKSSFLGTRHFKIAIHISKYAVNCADVKRDKTI